MSPGQNPGHTAGLAWGDLLALHQAAWGSLAALALRLAELRGFEEDVESVERGLRRLRGRGHGDGGVWGQRLLRCLGLPTPIQARLRWMGQYHSRFTDLPASLAWDLLEVWDRPPVSESPARAWLLLARLGLTLRQRADPQPLLAQLQLVEAQAEPMARIELALTRAFVWSRAAPEATDEALAEAGRLLAEAELPAEDAACLFARWIDQRAYPLNRPRQGPPDHLGAEALYLEIPPSGPLFARCRRENGLGWSRLRLGRRAEAQAHAQASLRYAGDAGSLRMRAMALGLLAATLEGAEAEAARGRALAIARALEDEALRMRFDHHAGAS
ncbi:hypothetical protein KKF91_09860 [Myxococcota bacterium]|nr:hypothetical protein [Myxococcota bacterium]MBU1430848.1 hypothetical protein [Myxococcota bacterium]MBU1899039.1 hypothetical protein [Myxococcota bacterium]